MLFIYSFKYMFFNVIYFLYIYIFLKTIVVPSVTIVIYMVIFLFSLRIPWKTMVFHSDIPSFY